MVGKNADDDDTGVSGGKSTQRSYLSKSKYTLIENDSSESHPVKYYLSKSIKVFGFRYT
jgi:hypothetical protein